MERGCAQGVVLIVYTIGGSFIGYSLSKERVKKRNVMDKIR